MFKRLVMAISVLGLSGGAASTAMAQPEVLVSFPSVEIRFGTSRPPLVVREVRPRRPAVEYVWAPGWWDWQGDRWVWVEGRWLRPEKRGARWVAAVYVREGDGWRYVPAHWSHQRVVEGDDYKRWKEQRKQHKHGHGHKHGGHRPHKHK